MALTCRQLYDVLDPFLYRCDFELDSLRTLRWAAKVGRISTIIKWLGYDIANEDQRAETLHGALHAAAVAGRDDAASFLLDQGACIECKDYQFEPPLSQAVRHFHESTAKVLLEHGANPDYVDFTSEPPLRVAAAEGHLAMVCLLLDNKAGLYATDFAGIAPVAIAAHNGHVVAVVELFADHNHIPLCSEHAIIRQAAIYQAVCGLSTETVRVLLRRGLSPPMNSRAGQALLQRACEVGSAEILDLFFNEGANIEAKYEAGMTILFLSTRLKNPSMLYYLVQKGADINATDDEGQTVIIYIVKNWANNTTLLEYLLDRQPYLDGRDNSGWTALLHATTVGAWRAVELLLAAGADPAVPTLEGITPLMRAAAGGYLQITQLLLKQYPDNLNALDNQGSSALYLAVKHSRYNLVPLLMEYGANASYRTREGRTLISVASGIGNSFTVRYLVTYGVDINSRDDADGRTPLMVAAVNKEWNMFTWLLANGANLSLQDNSGCDAITLYA